MALTTATIFEVQTGGSDTANSGGFDPSKVTLTDLAGTSANTNSPVVSSASYNFVAGDVGAKLYISSGTNYLPGWYTIASVASNQATLSAAIGAGQLLTYTPTTVTGCATVASPTAGSWAIDYSQQAATQYSLTGLTTAAANAVILTASASRNMIGNLIQITGGTNFITGVYVIGSVTAGVSITVDRNCTTAAGVSGTAGIGGAFASPGMAGSVILGSSRNYLHIKTGTYTITSATPNIAGGCITFPNGANATTPFVCMGYQTVRGDFGTPPTLILNAGVTGANIITHGSNYNMTYNLILDGNSQTTSAGSISGATTMLMYKVKFQNFTNGGYVGSSALVACEAIGCSTVAAISSGGAMMFCTSHGNTISGFTSTSSNQVMWYGCIAYNNTGGSSSGFLLANARLSVVNCTSYGNGNHGFSLSTFVSAIVNCLSEGNTGNGFSIGSTTFNGVLTLNLAAYNNTAGNFDAGLSAFTLMSPLQYSSTAFTNAAGGDFSLNNTAGGGASVRASGFRTFPAGTTLTYQDAGAAQHQDSGGTGTVAYIS